MKRLFFLAVAVALGVTAGGYALRLHRATSRARVELVKVQQRRAAEAAAAQVEVDRNRELRTQLAEAGARAAQLELETSRATAKRNPIRFPRTAEEYALVGKKRAAAYRNQPVLQVMYARRTRGFVLQEMGPFFAQAKLSPEAISRFVDAAVAYDLELKDITTVAEEHGLDSRSALANLRQQAAERRDQELHRILGDDGYRSFEEYQRTNEVRRMVGRLLGNAVCNGMPLSSTQADAAVAALLNASPDYAANQRATVTGINWNAADPFLRQILDPGQFALLLSDRGDTQLRSMLAKAVQAERAARLPKPSS